MDRAEILQIVTKHFRANVGMPDGVELDPSRSMLEQGAQSLDLLEIVSASMRELDVTVPRTELAAMTNIDELVDAFHARVQRKSA